MPKGRSFKVFSGSANPALTQEIVDYLGIPLGVSKASHSGDGESSIKIDESVRGYDVFVVQPTSAPVNVSIMELLIMVDALRRASARRITVVIPYYGYSRHDRKTRGREPITAKLVANLLTAGGVDRVVCVDLHAGQIQGFFDIPVDHLTAMPIIASHFQQTGLENFVLVSPDLGGVARSRKLSERIGGSIAMLDKQRLPGNKVVIRNVIGDVKGKNVIMVDDMIDTAGTMESGAYFLKEAGAAHLYICCTHPILSGLAAKRLAAAPVEEVVTTNTIAIPKGKRFPNLKILSVAKLLADAIIGIHEERSVSNLYR